MVSRFGRHSTGLACLNTSRQLQLFPMTKQGRFLLRTLAICLRHSTLEPLLTNPLWCPGESSGHGSTYPSQEIIFAIPVLHQL